jgi:ring-1,2-phenylacetyl-CoA epoxidase subunit PaaE
MKLKSRFYVNYTNLNSDHDHITNSQSNTFNLNPKSTFISQQNPYFCIFKKYKMTPIFHTLQIKNIRKETEDTVSIAFEIPQELRNEYTYISGQYLTLRTTIDGEDLRRSYSLCSAPHENEWRVAIKQVENGKFSTFANTSLKTGDSLEVMTPMGNFSPKIDASNKKHYVLFAAGSGITPILSIIKSVLHNESDSEISLFYGNKGFASIIFREEIEALKNEFMDRFRVIHILSRESLGNKIQKGRIDTQKIEELHAAFLKNTTIDEMYVCGPEEMIHAVKDTFPKFGVDAKNIHFELFGTSVVKKDKVETVNASIVSNVTVIIDGDSLEIALESTADNILDAAQKAGADLPFACKGGVCCTCKAKILEGTASMDVNYALEPDEVEAGYILTCQAHPTSEKLVVSFDD